MPRNETVLAFQKEICRRLIEVLDVPVEMEWASMRGSKDRYSPKLDIAVGPFAVENHIYTDEFDGLCDTHDRFLMSLYEFSASNLIEYGSTYPASGFDSMVYRNRNARCFLAIEIENEVSRKHLMGGAINAAALGRIGVVIGWTPEKVRALVRTRSYLLFLARVEKNTFDPYNLLILSPDQLQTAIGQAEPRASAALGA